MARQVRSEVTRRKILDAAVDVFGDVGYASAGWGTIIERTGMTKGALYHHFDSKEALASAIIEEGSDALLGAFRNVCGAASPALGNMIHGTFAVAHLLNADKTARAAEQLTAVLAGFNSAAAQFFGACAGEMAGQARRAIAEGDLRDDVDPELVGESIVGATFGMRLLANALSRSGGNGYRVESAGQRLGQLWGLLLPGMTVETSLPYFREFLAREAMRSRH
ncbi:TetR/AcrR family transcriptional regulator [Mycobacterium kansasii]|uniref:TetR/AcrR family transcriptional regulator n=1 Tax=Mycobacterium kansasii TaxID=1768 RepID=UPI000C08389D|nr:TetR/AcrR family transcriptional regulator [Mycobacterium kansasii]